MLSAIGKLSQERVSEMDLYQLIESEMKVEIIVSNRKCELCGLPAIGCGSPECPTRITWDEKPIVVVAEKVEL